MNVASGVNICVASFVPASSVLVSISEKKRFKSSRAGFGTSIEGHDVRSIRDGMIDIC